MDMDRLLSYYYKLLRELHSDFLRYIYFKIDWNSRMIGLTGPRGGRENYIDPSAYKKGPESG